jgi:hypothetical protein
MEAENVRLQETNEQLEHQRQQARTRLRHLTETVKTQENALFLGRTVAGGAAILGTGVLNGRYGEQSWLLPIDAWGGLAMHLAGFGMSMAQQGKTRGGMMTQHVLHGLGDVGLWGALHRTGIGLGAKWAESAGATPGNKSASSGAEPAQLGQGRRPLSDAELEDLVRAGLRA